MSETWKFDYDLVLAEMVEVCKWVEDLGVVPASPPPSHTVTKVGMMSRVYFHSPSGTAELHGSERAYLGGLCNDMALGVLDVGSWHTDRVTDLVDPREYPAPALYDFEGRQRWRQRVETALRVSDREVLSWRGHPLGAFSLILNTAVVTGSDAVKLGARIHGQCELHAWVDGPNRAWLADVMQQGLDAGVFRSGFWYAATPDGPKDQWSSQGWEKVMELLRSRADEPVVMSYSVCESFPNSTAAGWEPPPMPEGWAPNWADDDKGRAEWERDYADPERREEEYAEAAGDLWYDLPDAEQWRIAMEGLRASRDGLELKPDNWQTFRFRHRLSFLDLLASDRDERLAAVFEPAPETAEATG